MWSKLPPATPRERRVIVVHHASEVNKDVGQSLSCLYTLEIQQFVLRLQPGLSQSSHTPRLGLQASSPTFQLASTQPQALGGT
jgi:hypothetical protein